jgi:hypothetical protein
LGLEFQRENTFEKMIQMGNYTKKTDFITSMFALNQKIGDQEVPYFDKEFLIKRYLGLTMDEYRKNEEYKKIEAKEAKKLADAKPAEGAEESEAPAAEGGEEFTL